MLNGTDMSSLLGQVSASRLTYIRTVTIKRPAGRALGGCGLHLVAGDPVGDAARLGGAHARDRRTDRRRPAIPARVR